MSDLDFEFRSNPLFKYVKFEVELRWTRAIVAQDSSFYFSFSSFFYLFIIWEQERQDILDAHQYAENN